ncbi:MAG: signal peptidase II [Candidatus Omnitrophica bacterium]|nr:signal peptidase II [Candidatus Omnitrophota bacterium]
MKQKINICIYLLAMIFVFVLIDRATKIYMSELLSLGGSVVVIKNFLSLTLVHNQGIAFGLLKPYNAVLSGFVLIILITVFSFTVHEFRKLSILDKISSAMIIGGGASNLFDRFSYGHVIDFIDFHVWPVFNFADIFICTGFLIVSVRMYQKQM